MSRALHLLQTEKLSLRVKPTIYKVVSLQEKSMWASNSVFKGPTDDQLEDIEDALKSTEGFDTIRTQ